MSLRVCIAGATGWVGRDLVRAVAAANDMGLVGAVARTSAGQDIGTIVGIGALGVTIAATVEDALRAGVDVFVD